MATSRAEVLEFIRRHSLGVQASVSAGQRPQAAVVGFIITDTFELFFDTTEATRKTGNLRANAHAAFVIGGLGDGERTVQYEGITDEPVGAELAALQSLYFARFPDGPQRAAWPGITYFRVRPRWLRFSSFASTPPDITEISFD
jgi:Pyridoxamine 5'-phosphate oxidase